MPRNACAILSLCILGASLPMSGCGPACEDEVCGEIPVTPTPIPGTAVYGETFVSNPPRTWGMKREVLQEIFVPGEAMMEDAWYYQTTYTYFLVSWAAGQGGVWQQTEQYCRMDTSVVNVMFPNGEKEQVTVIPDKLIEHLPDDVWSFQFEIVADADVAHDTAQYSMLPSEFGPQYSVWGANIEDPTTQTCPVDSKASGWLDQDEDGYHGVTLDMWLDGEFYCSTMACQRFLFTQESGIVTFLGENQYRIKGRMYDVLVDQSQYGSINEPWPSPMDSQDPEVRWSDNENTYFIMTSLPDGSSCDNVTADLFK